MKTYTISIALFTVFIFIPSQTFCEDEVQVESLQLFYSQFKHIAEPEYEITCGVGMLNFGVPFCYQLKQNGTDFDALFETVLADQTKRAYWPYALLLYKLRYKQEPLTVQKKVFALLDRKYNFNDETVLNFYINLIGSINSTIYETNKADPMVYSYFKRDEVATIEYWQAKLTQQHRPLEPNPTIDQESYLQSHERTVTSCATSSMDIVIKLYLLSNEMDYYNILVKARKSKNQKISKETYYLLSEQHVATMRKLMNL